MSARRWSSKGAVFAAAFGLGLCLFSTAAPATQVDDPDLDGLTNLEEYYNGTDPYNSDTDGGGENDGSDVDFGQDPLDPADDEIQELDWAHAHAANTAVVVSFDVKLEYVALRLYRRTGSSADYVIVNWNVPPTGAYTDSGLVNGTTYFYCMMAIDSSGHRSAVTAPTQATPSPSAIFFDGFDTHDLSRWTTTSP